MSSKNRVSANKRIYYFGSKLTEGHLGMRDLLGSKGANLAEMTSIGLPVPAGFTITTTTCADYIQAGSTLSEDQGHQLVLDGEGA